ncbi:MAG: tetratricopeptide repeat protein [Myxococcales bacterium]|nr:tetratricopeptide repeat protein [Myxococcales bacterium]
MAEAATARAEGDIAQTPVMHLVLYLHGRGSNGTLFVMSPTGQQSRVRFSKGRPVAGRFPHPSAGLEAGLLPLFGYPSGCYSFYSEDLLPAGPGVHEGVVDPLSLAAASLDAYCRDDIVDALLLRYGDHPMRLQPGRPIDRLRLAGRAKGLLELLRASPDTVDNLVASSPLERAQSRRILYLLVVTKMVAPYQTKEGGSRDSRVRRVSMPSGQLPTPSSPRMSVSPSSPSASRSSGRPVSAVASLASLRPSMRSVQRPTVESHVDENDAEVRYRRAVNRLKSGRFDEVETAAEALIEEQPDTANYHALLAHALWGQSRGVASEEGVPRQLTEAVKRALELDDACARALYVKGQLYKQADKPKKALACFRRAERADRTLLDAKREARLLRRRLTDA